LTVNKVAKLEGFLRLPEMLAIIPVSKTAWWEGIRQGRYPKGVKLLARTTAWPVSEIRKLVEELGSNK
jgi:prophage regulatory protein